MISATRSSNESVNANIVSLDVGTSSVRSLLFDGNFNHFGHLGNQQKYEIDTTKDGGVEIDPDLLLKLVIQCLDVLHEQMAAGNLKASGVGISAFWHCFLGLDQAGLPTTPIIHLFDTRSAPQAEELKEKLDAAWVHETTGCVLHTSYWPAKLLWLRQNHADVFHRTARWVSFGDYLLRALHGSAADSTSMVSATGLWDYSTNDFSIDLLKIIGIERNQLVSNDNLDKPVNKLKPEYASRWPLFDGIPWCPAYGDGACNSIGSGCTGPHRFALMVGTSGALRVTVKAPAVTIPKGIWCYRVTRDRFLLGGSLSNGGDVFRWVEKTFRLPEDAESQIATRAPGAHGLTMLPYLAGERSPYWRPDLRAAITGMTLSTTPLDILQVALESVSLRFRQIYDLLTEGFGPPAQVVASGGALLSSPVWVQMMADALDRPIVDCLEPEASSKGAAMIAAEQIGLLADLDSVPVAFGETVSPNASHQEFYAQLMQRDRNLFDALYGSPHAPLVNH